MKITNWAEFIVVPVTDLKFLLFPVITDADLKGQRQYDNKVPLNNTKYPHTSNIIIMFQQFFVSVRESLMFWGDYG